jgi:hypothetical protein
MKKVLVIYMPIILVTLLISVPFIFPARLIWVAANARLLMPVESVSDETPPGELPVSLSNIEGVFRHGSADIAFHNIPLGTLEWNIDLPALVNGQLKSHLTLESASHKLISGITVASNHISVENLRGQIGAESINPFTAKFGLKMDGVLSITSINLNLEQQWLTSLRGDLSWNGGSIRYQTTNARANYTLTPLHGELTLPEGLATLEVFDSASQQETLNVKLTQEGWATATILRRFFDLAGKQWIKTETADDIALQLEQEMW